MCENEQFKFEIISNIIKELDYKLKNEKKERELVCAKLNADLLTMRERLIDMKEQLLNLQESDKW